MKTTISALAIGQTYRTLDCYQFVFQKRSPKELEEAMQNVGSLTAHRVIRLGEVCAEVREEFPLRRFDVIAHNSHSFQGNTIMDVQTVVSVLRRH